MDRTVWTTMTEPECKVQRNKPKKALKTAASKQIHPPKRNIKKKSSQTYK